MKQIVKLGVNKYIHLDSYETGETPVANFLVAILCIGIGAITVGAAMGVDITNIQPNTIQQTK
jgi:hypothetical protein